MRNRFRERFFALLFTISFLFNINQCSNKSGDFRHSAEMTRIELSGVKTELSILKKEVDELTSLLTKNKEQKENKADKSTSNKKVNQNIPVVVDSIPVQPILIETVDSTKTN